MNAWKVKEFQHNIDDSGILSVLEFEDLIDFPIKRIFWLHGISNPKVIRGNHAHKDLMQLMVAVQGSCKIQLTDKSGYSEEILLSNPGKCLVVRGDVWRTMTDFKEHTVLLVLCDRAYKDDYLITELDEFLDR